MVLNGVFHLFGVVTDSGGNVRRYVDSSVAADLLHLVDNIFKIIYNIREWDVLGDPAVAKPAIRRQFAFPSAAW